MLYGPKDMPDKDPTNWGVAVWALGFVMAAIGGAVNHLSNYQRNMGINWCRFAIDVFTSGFIGLCAFMALAALDAPIGLSGAAAGVCGHMSTRLLFVVERKILEKIEKDK